MIRNTIITTIFLLLTSTAFCQKRNAKGQKVVSKIEIISSNDSVPYVFIDFTYDNSLRLIGITYYAPASERRIFWKKDSNTLTRKEVWYYKSIYQPARYSYKFNAKGLISELVINNIGIDKSNLAFKHWFTYDSDGRLTMIFRREFYNDYGKQPRELSDRYKTFYKTDGEGNLNRMKASYNWRYEGKKDEDIDTTFFKRWDYPQYDNDVVDDTNLNLAYMLWNYCRTDYFEMYTEWINCHSEHLLKKLSGDRYEYVYDSNKNIIQINKYQFFFDTIMERYKIYYLK